MLGTYRKNLNDIFRDLTSIHDFQPEYLAQFTKNYPIYEIQKKHR